jgi:DNA polymerase-3 subunit gamma/tau
MKDKLTFYRRFRPKQIAAVVGQEVARTVIEKSCEKESFHHAYLFHGPYGCGKTTVARLLAAMLTCENRENGSSVICRKCEGCTRALAGGGVDIREFNGALNGHKEEIRDLLDSMRFSPQSLSKKVFIIDEFHELSNAAMTALLKPIEEPPGDVVFILCTTDYHKVPAAIRSRCRNLHFSPITVSTISNYLEKLASHLEVKYDVDALKDIAISSRGSMRTALNTFETVCITNDQNVNTSTVRFYLGLGSRDEMHNLIENIGKKDYVKVLASVESILLSGADIRSVCYEMGELFRFIMQLKAGKDIDMNQDEMLIIKDLAANFELGDLIKIPKILSSVDNQLVLNINHQWVLESTVLEIIGV